MLLHKFTNRLHIARAPSSTSFATSLLVPLRPQCFSYFKTSSDLQHPISAHASPTQTTSTAEAEDTPGTPANAVVAPQEASFALQAEQPQSPTSDADRVDLYKAIAVGTLLSVAISLLGHDWVASHQELAMALVFGIGYVGIIIEDTVGFNKAGVALVMSVSLWVIRASAGDSAAVSDEVGTC
jgi:hypothetical protein